MLVIKFNRNKQIYAVVFLLLFLNTSFYRILFFQRVEVLESFTISSTFYRLILRFTFHYFYSCLFKWHFAFIFLTFFLHHFRYWISLSSTSSSSIFCVILESHNILFSLLVVIIITIIIILATVDYIVKFLLCTCYVRAISSSCPSISLAVLHTLLSLPHILLFDL